MPLLLATHALGTRVELALDEPDSPGLRAVGEEAMAEIHLWHERLSYFQPESFLSFINRSAGHRRVSLDEDLWSLLDLCQRVHTASAGAFDPTVAGLLGRAGLHAAVPASIHDEPADTGWTALVELDEAERTIQFRQRGVRLDLGGVAKGFALDRASETLLRHGVHSAVLHAGTSSVVVLGPAPRTLGVRAGGSRYTLTLRQACLSVSAPRGRVVGDVTHIMDPRIGSSARCVDTALVVGAIGSGAEADAWSTALVALNDRPLAMPEPLRSAIHDGRTWSVHRIQLEHAPEAA